jgi:hypothetical protein
MKVKDIINKMNNGAVHVVLVDDNTGEVILKTIWHNCIPDEHLNKSVKHIGVTDYTITLMVK